MNRGPQPRTRADAVWLVALTLAVVATGMAYSLWWPAVVRHQPFYWVMPGDMWFSVRTAHWIAWGSLSYVYSNPSSSLVTLPGFNILLAPVVALGSALHLTEVAPGLFGPGKPTEYLLVGPVSLACSGLPLFALDALARRLGVARLRRRVLGVAVAAAVWSSLAIWGHPEDSLALGLAVYALVLLLNERWAPAGWLLGAALCMQLLVVMVIPILIGLVGWRRGAALLARAAILPGSLLVAVLVPDFRDAFRVLANQPGQPAVNHPTPWLALAPSLGHGQVSGGPGRLLNGAVAVGAGFLAFRWRRDPWRVVWLAALVLAARPVFEAVMVPYYVMPGVALALVSACRRPLRLLVTAMAGAGLTVMAFSHHGSWEYWLPLVALSAAVLVSAWPAGVRTMVAEQATSPDRSGDPASLTDAPVPALVGVTGGETGTMTAPA